MSVPQFFAYLLDRDTTRELALQLAAVYAARTRGDEKRMLAHA